MGAVYLHHPKPKTQSSWNPPPPPDISLLMRCFTPQAKSGNRSGIPCRRCPDPPSSPEPVSAAGLLLPVLPKCHTALQGSHQALSLTIGPGPKCFYSLCLVGFRTFVSTSPGSLLRPQPGRISKELTNI